MSDFDGHTQSRQPAARSEPGARTKSAVLAKDEAPLLGEAELRANVPEVPSRRAARARGEVLPPLTPLSRGAPPAGKRGAEARPPRGEAARGRSDAGERPLALRLALNGAGVLTGTAVRRHPLLPSADEPSPRLATSPALARGGSDPAHDPSAQVADDLGSLTSATHAVSGGLSDFDRVEALPPEGHAAVSAAPELIASDGGVHTEPETETPPDEPANLPPSSARSAAEKAELAVFQRALENYAVDGTIDGWDTPQNAPINMSDLLSGRISAVLAGSLDALYRD